MIMSSIDVKFMGLKIRVAETVTVFRRILLR